MRCPHCGVDHRPITNPRNPRSSSPGKALFIAGVAFFVCVLAAAIQLGSEAPMWWSVLPPLLIASFCVYYSFHLTKSPTIRTCRSCGREVDVKPWSL